MTVAVPVITLYGKALRGTVIAPITMRHKVDKSHVSVVSLAPLCLKTGTQYSLEAEIGTRQYRSRHIMLSPGTIF